MNVIRFEDLVRSGRVAGQRVFIRVDLNVPQDNAGRITEDTRIRASVPCIRMALDAGAAVMVTSHLGRPTEDEFRPTRPWRAIAASSAFSIAGGGDTLAAIRQYGIEKDVGYISTGGGAFLEVLEGKTLPALQILAQRAES